jgi:hypothetical protein
MTDIRKYIVTGIKQFVNMAYALKHYKYTIFFESILSSQADNLNMEGRGVLECVMVC